MRFNININNMLGFTNSFHFLSNSLDSLAKSFVKDDFKYLSQEFDNDVLDLTKNKVFYFLKKGFTGF